MNIKTNFVYPPIPDRSHDWCAWYGDLGEDASPYGYGQTEQEAIDDLNENSSLTSVPASD